MRYFSDDGLNELALRIRAFAEEQAGIRNLKFWDILRNKAIINICKKLPTSIDEFQSKRVIVGKKVVENYGNDIVNIVNEWREDNKDYQPMLSDDPLAALESKNVIKIKQSGFYYGVTGNDALLLHKYLGYKLYGGSLPKTGFPVVGQDSVLKKLDQFETDYDLVNQAGKIIVSKRFENNRYKMVSEDELSSLEAGDGTMGEKNRSFEERTTSYVSVLRGLSNNVDVVTGELVEGLSENVRSQLFEMAVYFEERIKSRETKTLRYPNQGAKWSSEEDAQLLAEYQEGKTAEEMSEIHGRSVSGICSRLLKVNAIK